MIITAVSEAPVGGIAGWAADLMEKLGGPGAGLAIALENLFPPLPSEVILPLAGFTAGQGRLHAVAAVAWTTAGSLAGALALYLLGALFGRDRMIGLAERLPLVKVSDVERTEAWFARHGTKAVFFGRFIPVFRSLISIPAGVERMRLPSFLALTTAGSLLWNTAFIAAGYALGARWHQVTDLVGLYSKAVLVGVALAALVVLALRVSRRGRGLYGQYGRRGRGRRRRTP
ncbi:DedA family protein [Streptomyces olivaceiscleroticus]|uniref:VTT domain-containing protein n=1 Tax=Streptomyces olivaceiscleroticus TaxID=68245 RepID=A0ABP3JFV8_9ACTN